MQIISGQYRGRRLAVPQGKQTRPTLTRVRQVLFDILQHSDLLPDGWAGRRVLDVFAGSGSLGLEALSRGAAWVGFYENDPQAQQVLIGNIRHLCAEDKCAVHADALRPARHDPPVDLVLCDPPYHQVELWQSHLGALRRQGGLSNRALLVTQVPKRAAPCSSETLIRHRQLGITRLDFYDVGA